MNDSVVQLIDSFLEAGRRRSPANFVFLRKELIDYVIPKLLAERQDPPPHSVISDIDRFLRLRGNGRVARIGIGQYELGGQEKPKGVELVSAPRAFAVPDGPRQVQPGAPSPLVGEVQNSSDLGAALKELLAGELANVGALARSKTFLVKSALEDVDLTSLKGLSF